MFSVEEGELRLDQVEAIVVRQEVIGRLLGYGDILVTGTSGHVLLAETFANPMVIKKVCEQAATGDADAGSGQGPSDLRTW